MKIVDGKRHLRSIERDLDRLPFVEFHTFDRAGRRMRVAVTNRLRKAARKEGVWRSQEMISTLKNASYGFDDAAAKSAGGRDGIYLLTRAYRPANTMMVKLFDKFLDKPGSGADELAAAMGVTLTELIPVRLVSHHMRLLGVLARKDDGDLLVLLDCDRSK